MMPSATALTRMPRPAYSVASDLVTAFSPPLVSDAERRRDLRVGMVDQAGGDVHHVTAAVRESMAATALRETSKKPRKFTPVIAS